MVTSQLSFRVHRLPMSFALYRRPISGFDEQGRTLLFYAVRGNRDDGGGEKVSSKDHQSCWGLILTVKFSLNMDYPGKAQASAAAVAKKLLGLAALFLVFQKVQRRLRCEFFLRLWLAVANVVPGAVCQVLLHNGMRCLDIWCRGDPRSQTKRASKDKTCFSYFFMPQTCPHWKTERTTSKQESSLGKNIFAYAFSDKTTSHVRRFFGVKFRIWAFTFSGPCPRDADVCSCFKPDREKHPK